MSVFEIIMLLCFGASWPLSIAKALRTRVVAGKSPLFMVIVIAGYLSGVLHKIVYSPDWVIALYALNLILVAIDLALYVRFSKNGQGLTTQGFGYKGPLKNRARSARNQ